jgi:fumarate reductase flavoprotein subunit
MQFDVVTVGGGFSGLIPACRAADSGLSVAVLEARSEDRYPCSSRYSTGVGNVMGLPIMAEPDRLFRAIMDGSGDNASTEVARAVADNSQRAVAWLTQQGAVFAQRALQHDQPGQKVLAPPRRSCAGLDWDDKGPDRFMRQLEANLTRRGGTLLRGAKVEALVIENGACVGVSAVRDGKPLRIAARSVVIADGGFAANRDMIAKYITPRADRVLCRVGPGANGDGIRMAEAAGAAIRGLGAFYGHIHHRNAMTNATLWPYPHLDAAAEVGILVGPGGKRFTDEGLGGVCMANAIARLPDPLSAWLIVDDAIWRKEPSITTTVPANPSMVEAGGEIVSAADVDKLAARIGLPVDPLAQAVHDHNLAVERSDFSRFAVPRTVRKHQPLPIAVAPFHAVPLCTGVTGTMGGIAINAQAQALKPDGSVFAGLYAVGTPVFGLEGGARAGYCGGLSKAYVLGLLAGDHIAAAATAAAH